MSRLLRRHTNEMAAVAQPGLRLLPAMLLGVAAAAAVTYFALGLRPVQDRGLPEIVLRIDGETLAFPDGRVCHLPHGGCAGLLATLPAAELRLLAPPGTPFAAATPVLQLAADARHPALLDDGAGPVEVHPLRPEPLHDWSVLNSDAPGVRLRVILRADGIWLGSADGKVLGADPHGPTLLPTADGPDFVHLARKLEAVKSNLPETETTCAVLPSLDTSFTDVVHAVATSHGTFETVLLAVP